MLCNPYTLGGPQTKGDKIRSGCLTPAFSGAQKRVEVVRNPCILGGPRRKGEKSEVAASPLPSWGPTKGRKCYVTSAFSRGPKQGRDKIRIGCLNPAFAGPERGRKSYETPAFSGSPNKGGKNHIWLPHPCLVRGPKEGGSATKTLHSRGPQTKGDNIRIGCLTPAFLGAHKRVESLHNP